MGDGLSRAVQPSRLLLVAGMILFAGLILPTLVEAAPAPSTLPGIDVSHHNGKPDWAQVKADGTRFVFAKATEGTTFVDPEYATNKQQVESLGMAFTAYHFAQPDTSIGDAVAEADWFIANAQLTGKNLIPVLDLEASNGLGVKKLTRWTKDWLNEVQARLGVKALIYTNTPFWKSFLGNTTWFADNGYRLWVAHWTTATQPSVPAANWGGHGWTFWQYSNCGTVAGITGCVDADRYNGTSLAPLKIKNNR